MGGAVMMVMLMFMKYFYNLPLPKLNRLLFSRVCLTIKVFEMVNGETVFYIFEWTSKGQVLNSIHVIIDIRELVMVVDFEVVIRIN